MSETILTAHGYEQRRLASVLDEVEDEGRTILGPEKRAGRSRMFASRMLMPATWNRAAQGELAVKRNAVGDGLWSASRARTHRMAARRRTEERR
jgi:hypothetical protein